MQDCTNNLQILVAENDTECWVKEDWYSGHRRRRNQFGPSDEPSSDRLDSMVVGYTIATQIVY